MEGFVLLVIMLLVPFSVFGQEVSVYFNGQPNARENYTIMCNVSLADGEQENNLTVEWLAPSGSVVESDNGTTQIIYTFNPLLPSHGGEYRCRATLLQGDQVLLLGEDTVNVIVSVPPPEVTSKYEGVPAGYVLWCYVKLIEDTPLLVDGLTIEWFNQSDGSSLKKRSGTNLNKDSSGARQLGIEHKPQMTSDGGSYTCQALLQGNMFITPQQPVTNETYTVTVKIPTPSVTIVEPSGTLYVGDGLQCQVEISDSVDTPVDVNYTWKNESGEVVSSGVADGSVTIELSVSTGGSYSCEAMVIPSGSTEFILPSGIGINTLYIEVAPGKVATSPTSTILNTTDASYVTGFVHGFAAGLVSGALILCGLAGLVAAVVSLLMKKRRGVKPNSSFHCGVKDGVEMAECAAYAECAPPTTTCTARGPVDQKQDREIEREQSPVYEFILPH